MADVVGAVDAYRLAELLTVRFRLGLAGEVRRSNNTVYPCVRAIDLKAPNGFLIQITLGWRSIEAAFVPDNYAGDLIRSMGRSTAAAREHFGQTAESFAELGARLTLRINDSAIAIPVQLPAAPWSRFELKVLRMSEATTIGGDVLLKDAMEVGATCLALVLALLPLEEESPESVPLFETALPEGAKTRVEVNRYERSPVNRAACIAKFGTFCNACGFDFGLVYGPLGEGYIEVHHIVPVSSMGDGYIVNPMVDLIPLCANCHALIHRQDPPMTLAALKALLQEAGLQSLRNRKDAKQE